MLEKQHGQRMATESLMSDAAHETAYIMFAATADLFIR